MARCLLQDKNNILSVNLFFAVDWGGAGYRICRAHNINYPTPIVTLIMKSLVTPPYIKKMYEYLTEFETITLIKLLTVGLRNSEGYDKKLLVIRNMEWLYSRARK